MGFQDALNYVLFNNPVCSGLGSYIWNATTVVPQYLGLSRKVDVTMGPPVILSQLVAATGPFVKIAAVSGAAAVVLGAYGSHREYPKGQELKQVFEIASRYHFIHTLALLGAPLCKRPYLVATFMLSGMVMFSGTCYHYSFTGDKRWSGLMPIGGTCFIIGWLSMCI